MLTPLHFFVITFFIVLVGVVYALRLKRQVKRKGIEGIKRRVEDDRLGDIYERWLELDVIQREAALAKMTPEQRKRHREAEQSYFARSGGMFAESFRELRRKAVEGHEQETPGK